MAEIAPPKLGAEVLRQPTVGLPDRNQRSQPLRHHQRRLPPGGFCPTRPIADSAAISSFSLASSSSYFSVEVSPLFLLRTSTASIRRGATVPFACCVQGGHPSSKGVRALALGVGPASVACSKLAPWIKKIRMDNAASRSAHASKRPLRGSTTMRSGVGASVVVAVELAWGLAVSFTTIELLRCLWT